MGGSRDPCPALREGADLAVASQIILEDQVNGAVREDVFQDAQLVKGGGLQRWPSGGNQTSGSPVSGVVWSGHHEGLREPPKEFRRRILIFRCSIARAGLLESPPSSRGSAPTHSARAIERRKFSVERTNGRE